MPLFDCSSSFSFFSKSRMVKLVFLFHPEKKISFFSREKCKTLWTRILFLLFRLEKKISSSFTFFQEFEEKG